MKMKRLVLLFLFFPLFTFGEELTCPIARQILSNAFTAHYSVNEATEQLIEDSILNYVDNADRSKVFLTQEEYKSIKSDIKKNKKHYLKFFMTQKEIKARTYLGVPLFSEENCYFLLKAYSAIKHGRDRYESVFNEVLVENVTSSKETEFKPLKKRLKTERELISHLKKFFKFKQKNDDLLEIKDYLNAKNNQKKSYLTEFINSVLTVMDPHSGYIEGESLKEFKKSMASSQDGFGFFISKSKKTKTVLVLKVFKNSPISKTIITAGDEILEVNGKSVENMSLNDFQNSLRETEPDSENVFKVRSYIDKKEFPDEYEEIMVKVNKGHFDQEKVSHTVEKKDGKVFIKIKLDDFYNDCSTDFENEYLKAKQEHPVIDGIMVDLRRNYGGNVDDVLKISNLFLGRKIILQTENKDSSYPDLTYSSDNIFAFIPLIREPLLVLTNRQSASASEIFAGTMKIYKRGLIVGDDHTYGKGSMQSINSYEAFDLGYLKLTKNLYFLANGESPQFVGIKSDVIIPSDTRFAELGEKQINFSIKPKNKLKNQIVSDFNLVDSKFISKLQGLSKKRVKSNEDFKQFDNKKSIESWTEKFNTSLDIPDIVLTESLNVFNDYLQVLNDH